MRSVNASLLLHCSQRHCSSRLLIITNDDKFQKKTPINMIVKNYINILTVVGKQNIGERK